MVTRRHVLKSGAAGVATVFASASVRARTAVEKVVASTGFCRVVFDERFGESREFARAFDERGVSTSAIGTDLAPLWYSDLRAQLRRMSLPFAGLTDRATLFCLEELARDVDMKVLYRVDRTLDSNGNARLEASGSTGVVDASGDLDAGVGYGRAMASFVSRVFPHSNTDVAACKRTGPFANEADRALVCWVIS